MFQSCSLVFFYFFQFIWIYSHIHFCLFSYKVFFSRLYFILFLLRGCFYFLTSISSMDSIIRYYTYHIVEYNTTFFKQLIVFILIEIKYHTWNMIQCAYVVYLLFIFLINCLYYTPKQLSLQFSGVR